jgi:integrase/recombinase XerD
MNEKNTLLIEKFIQHLAENKYNEKTIAHYKSHIKNFLEWLESPSFGGVGEAVTYNDLLSYVRHLQKKNISIQNQNKQIRAVKYLYNYFIQKKETIFNPAANLFIKGHIQRLPNDLLSKEYLHHIYENYQLETATGIRNKCMLGLLIYQGLHREELIKIEPQDIDLTKGTVYIKQGQGNRRHLKLEANQILPLQQYITNSRKEIIKQSENPTDRLFMTLGSSASMKDSLRELANSLKKKYSELKHYRQIRNSVISEWLKKHPIREVQYMAGHNSITSTERYKQANVHDLQLALNLFHPLKE